MRFLFGYTTLHFAEVIKDFLFFFEIFDVTLKSAYTVKYNDCYNSRSVNVKALRFQPIVSFMIRNDFMLLSNFLRGLVTGLCFFFSCRYWSPSELLKFWMIWNILSCSIYFMCHSSTYLMHGFWKAQETFRRAIVCLEPSYSRIIRVRTRSLAVSDLRSDIWFESGCKQRWTLCSNRPANV